MAGLIIYSPRTRAEAMDDYNRDEERRAAGRSLRGMSDAELKAEAARFGIPDPEGLTRHRLFQMLMDRYDI